LNVELLAVVVEEVIAIETIVFHGRLDTITSR